MPLKVCDVWTLARMAGHSSNTVSSRYVHPSECRAWVGTKLGTLEAALKECVCLLRVAIFNLSYCFDCAYELRAALVLFQSCSKVLRAGRFPDKCFPLALMLCTSFQRFYS